MHTVCCIRKGELPEGVLRYGKEFFSKKWLLNRFQLSVYRFKNMVIAVMLRVVGLRRKESKMDHGTCTA